MVQPQTAPKPYAATRSLPTLGWRRELEKWEKTHCLRQNRLKREGKSCVHKQSKTRILVTTFHGQGDFQQSPGKPDHIMLNSYLGRKILWCLLFLLLAPALHTEHEVRWHWAFPGSPGVCCLGCASSRFLAPQASLLVGWGGRKSLGAVQVLLNNSFSIPLMSKLFSAIVKKIALYQLLWSSSPNLANLANRKCTFLGKKSERSLLSTFYTDLITKYHTILYLVHYQLSVPFNL